MNILTALRLGPQPRIAFVGAGGKTTAMFRLARELMARPSHPPAVLLTTTTHLGLDQARLADRWQVVSTPGEVEVALQDAAGLVLLTGPATPDNRVSGLAGDALERLFQLVEQAQPPLLVEADGSRMRPLKAPAVYEPVIPAWISDVVVVAGLSGLGQRLDGETVHRPEIFSELSGLSQKQPVTIKALARVLAHPQGGLKGIPSGARRTLLLNQADTPERLSQAKRLAEILQPVYPRIAIASLQNPQEEMEVEAVYTPIAGVLLAAGGSSRFGRPKQLLDWRGQPLVRHIAQVGLAAGLDPLVVVIGAHSAEIRQALEGLPVTIVENPDWEAGQSTSLRAGLQALPAETGAAVFLLSDQPQTPERLIASLVEIHRQTQSAIIAPMADGRRANPVLFDRAAFPDLLALQGDTGGRAVFSKYRVTYLEWLDPRQALDIDTPEDYQRLLESSNG